MFRRSIQFLALGAFAAVAAPGGAAANPCCACVQVVCEQFYIVNHGPVYSGPGIVVSPAYFEQDRWPTVYPCRPHLSALVVPMSVCTRIAGIIATTSSAPTRPCTNCARRGKR
jgi:hypothetical protein